MVLKGKITDICYFLNSVSKALNKVGCGRVLDLEHIVQGYSDYKKVV